MCRIDYHIFIYWHILRFLTAHLAAHRDPVPDDYIQRHGRRRPKTVVQRSRPGGFTENYQRGLGTTYQARSAEFSLNVDYRGMYYLFVTDTIHRCPL